MLFRSFAITFHRKRRETLKSLLEDIPNIGKAKARALMKHFKSIDKITTASALELQEVDGIGETFAITIYNHFHKDEMIK